MARRFYHEFYSIRGQAYTIEVHDTDFAGTESTFNAGADGFTLVYNGDNQQRTGTVLATSCSVQFRLETSDHEDFFEEIIASKESRFTLKITKGTGTPTLFWVGLILTDVGGYEEAYRPYFTLKAVDGLGLLRDVDYKDGSSVYTGKASLKDQLINALTKLEYVDTHFATTERFLRIGVDFWGSTMTNNSTNDPMALTYTNQEVWLTYQKNVVEARSCFEVIENIMRCFGAQITMHEGVFWVHQVTYRNTATIVLRSYDKAGTYLSSNNFSSQNTINQTASGALFSGGVYEFFAPLSEARHTFEVNLHQNLLAGHSFSNTNTADTVLHPVEANSGATTLWLSGNLTLKIINPSFTAGPLVQPGFAIFRCQLNIGSKWLENDYTVQNYQVNFGSFVWESVNSYFYIAVALPNGLPPPQTLAGNIFYTYTQAISVMTPQLPTGADDFDFSIELIEYTQGISLVNFTSTWDFPKPWLEPFSFGNPALNDDEWEFVSENPDVENTLIHETKCLIGTSTDPNATGALWEKPAADYVLSEDWGDGTDTPDRPIEKLNVELVLGGQQHPIRRLSGTLYGTNLVLMGRVVWEGANWLLLGCSFNANDAQAQGEWHELDYDGAGLSTSGPIRYKRQGIPGLPEVPPLDGGGNFTGNATYKLNAAGPGTLLYPVAQSTTSSDEIQPGVKTSIDIDGVLASGDYYITDTIVILNPVTGFWEELTVDATSVDFDTAIDVSGTLTGYYPPFSPIIKKPRIGTFSLPAGYTGAILRHNGIKWLPYGAGTTDGHVLTWDSTNGWQAEAPSGSGGGTVTSVALTMPTAIFDVAGSPITTSGTLAVTLDNQSANQVFAGPTGGGAATPAFRALVAADIPNLDFSKITTGIVPIAQGGTNLSALGTANQLLRVNAGATALEYFTHSFLTANQTITLSGDVTGSGSTAITTTIANDAVTYAKIQNVTTARLLGRATAGSGDTEEISLGATLAFSGTALQTAAHTGDVTTSANSFATTIATNAVTDAKFRQSAGLSVVGRSANTTGNVADITAASDFQVLRRSGTSVGFGAVNLASSNAVTGTLPVANGGTGAATFVNDRVLTGNGTSAIVDEANLLFNGTQLQVGTGTPAALFNVFAGSVGTTEMIRMSANSSGNLIMSQLNANNATTAANSMYQISVGGSAAGDPFIQFTVNGVGQTTIGVDNSDADKFKITPGASVPGGTVNRGLIVTNDTVARVGVNIDLPLQPLHVSGIARASLWAMTQQNPTAVLGTGAGSAAGVPGVVNGVVGGPNGFQITFTTGNSVVANGIAFIVTLGTAFPAQHLFVPGARNAQAATDLNKFYISAFSTTQITVSTVGSLAVSTQYIMNWVGTGY